MFGTNPIVGRKYFEGKEDQLKVTSLFYTLQGEGPFAGRPAVFLRLSHCNLNCWFCDTNFETGDWFTTAELMEKVDSLIEDKPMQDTVFVVTGGEPLLQDLRPILLSASNLFHATQIESNGLFRPDALLPNTVLVVSPKADNLTRHYQKPPKETLERANCLKFVLTNDRTSVHHTVPGWALEWRDKYKRHVYVSPMAEYTHFTARRTGKGDLVQRTLEERVSFWEPGLLDLDRVKANHLHAASYALEQGLFLSLQMHLFAGLP